MFRQGVVANIFNPTTPESGAGIYISMSSRQAWCTELVPRQPELHGEILSRILRENMYSVSNAREQTQMF